MTEEKELKFWQKPNAKKAISTTLLCILLLLMFLLGTFSGKQDCITGCTKEYVESHCEEGYKLICTKGETPETISLINESILNLTKK